MGKKNNKSPKEASSALASCAAHHEDGGDKSLRAINFSELHDVITQTTELFILNGIRTSDHNFLYANYIRFNVKYMQCVKIKLFPIRPWRPRGLWDAEDRTLSRQSAVRLPASCTGSFLLSRNILFLLLVFISIRGWVYSRAYKQCVSYRNIISYFFCFNSTMKQTEARTHKHFGPHVRPKGQELNLHSVVS
jgi:hypothetical protein